MPLSSLAAMRHNQIRLHSPDGTTVKTLSVLLIYAATLCGMEVHAQSPHACSIVTREALERAAGTAFKEGRKLMRNCIFDTADGRGRVTVQVGFPGDGLSDYPDQKHAMELAGAKLVPVSGLGDEAVWADGPDHLLLRKGGHLIDVDPGLTGKGSARERATAIAQAVLLEVR